MPGPAWSTLDYIGVALACIGLGVLLIAVVPTGGARPGQEEWRAAIRRHRWQPRHTAQPRPAAPTAPPPPAGMSLEDSLCLIELACQMRQWPAQDRWPDTDLVRRYVPGRHTKRVAA